MLADKHLYAALESCSVACAAAAADSDVNRAIEQADAVMAFGHELKRRREEEGQVDDEPSLTWRYVDEPEDEA